MIEFNERKVIRNRNVKRELDRRSTREMSSSIAIGFLFAGLMCVYSWQQHRMVEYGYRIEALKNEQAQLAETRRKLERDHAALESPVRIFRVAQELGLVSPRPGQVIFDLETRGDRPESEPAVAWQTGDPGAAAAAVLVSSRTN